MLTVKEEEGTKSSLETKEEKKSNSTDQAIERCEEVIKKHVRRAALTITITIGIVAFILMIIAIFVVNLDAAIGARDLPLAAVYLVLALIVLCLSIGTSIYRTEIKEIAKFEQYLVGFMRIRIAAHNVGEGYQTEVRKALTDGAFHFESKSGIFGGGTSKDEKKVESPIPGHPGSDVGTELINKLLNSFEFKAEAKK